MKHLRLSKHFALCPSYRIPDIKPCSRRKQGTAPSHLPVSAEFKQYITPHQLQRLIKLPRTAICKAITLQTNRISSQPLAPFRTAQASDPDSDNQSFPTFHAMEALYRIVGNQHSRHCPTSMKEITKVLEKGDTQPSTTTLIAQMSRQLWNPDIDDSIDEAKLVDLSCYLGMGVEKRG